MNRSVEVEAQQLKNRWVPRLTLWFSGETDRERKSTVL